MAKKNNSPKAPAAPKTEQPKNNVNNTPAAAPATGFTNPTAYMQGLDPNHQVDLTRMMHETFRLDPNAAKKYNMAEETIAKINEANAIAQVCILANEVTLAQNPFAIRMRDSQLKVLTEIANTVGVSINPNLLPAPDTEGIVEIPSAAIEVSDETKETLKQEAKIAENNVDTIDPTKIENNEQLIDAIKKIMVTRANAYEKVKDSVAFYRSHLSLHTTEEHPVPESDLKLFEQITELIGPAPLVLNGVGRYMYTTTSTTKSPISAFCSFRNSTKNKKTGAFALDDQTVADYTKVMVKWAAKIAISNAEKLIKGYEANLAVLKKDAKKNADGIKDTEAKITTQKENIAHFNEAIGYVSNPGSEVPATLIDNYKAHDSSAMRMYKAIADSYYDDINIKEMKTAGVNHNIEQYAGIITNLFRDTVLEEYSAANIVELQPMGNSTEEPEKKDDDSKKE